MSVSDQDRIIGSHSCLKSILKDWLQCTDLPATSNQCIRYLNENSLFRQALIRQCSWWVVMYHIGSANWRRLKSKRKTMSTNEFNQYLAQKQYLPQMDVTRKGNLGEILLIAYLNGITRYTPYVRKLTYNPNVNQSMKGDDVLLFNPSDITKDVIYAESKVRSTPSKAAITMITDNLQGSKRFPTSLNFVIQVLRDRGNDELADMIDELQINILSGNTPIRNVGWLLSSRCTTISCDTYSCVVKSLNVANNPNLAFIAVGIDNVQDFVDEVYSLAQNVLITGIL